MYSIGGISIPELKNLVIPDNTIMEEHSIMVDGDVVIGSYAEIGFGLVAKRVITGEHVKINGSIISENDVRIDMWSEITGDVRTKTDAYLGEFVKIHGKLSADGNLDIGNNVKISKGYDVKGWIVVRNPLPIFLFIFFYLMALLHLGREEEVEKAFEELFSEDFNKMMIIPDKTRIDLLAIKTPASALIGSYCKLIGNLRADSLCMGSYVTLFGSVRTLGSVTIGKGCTIHGNIVSNEGVTIGRNCNILGKVKASIITMHESSSIKGGVSASDIIVEHDDLEGLNELQKRLFYGFALLD